ncbi:hypothetical protein LP419_25580 [Massilia sp. H-1]|nr:hypothetical protein LP419_25580 [Massilia sp. H-1]
MLAAEMKNGLRQVEKVLDDYYADGSKRPTLTQIDPVLHQLQGAVAILDQEDAMRAALHVKEAVRAGIGRRQSGTGSGIAAEHRPEHRRAGLLRRHAGQEFRGRQGPLLVRQERRHAARSPVRKAERRNRVRTGTGDRGSGAGRPSPARGAGTVARDGRA